MSVTTRIHLTGEYVMRKRRMKAFLLTLMSFGWGCLGGVRCLAFLRKSSGPEVGRCGS